MVSKFHGNSTALTQAAIDPPNQARPRAKAGEGARRRLTNPCIGIILRGKYSILSNRRIQPKRLHAYSGLPEKVKAAPSKIFDLMKNIGRNPQKGVSMSPSLNI